jgi:phosphoribosyl 1,2-cyclic phosphodiesterase
MSSLFIKPGSLNVQSFGSSSAGNATVVWNDDTTILLDCGFSESYIRKCLNGVDKDYASINAIFITHAHNDHINRYALRALSQFNVPVYCARDVGKYIQTMMTRANFLFNEKTIRVFPDKELTVGSFIIRQFQVPHDAEGGCYGYEIIDTSSKAEKKICFASDIGYVTKELLRRYIDSDIIIIESNHDIDMLDNSRRSAWLKNRIKEIGHLSNDQCGDFLVEVLRKSSSHPRAVLLVHLSKECNTREIAYERIRHALSSAGGNDITLSIAYRDRHGEIISV